MKKLLLMLFCVLALLFSACTSVDLDAVRDAVDSGRTDGGSSGGEYAEDDAYAFENDAQKLAADQTFYNGYLGVSYTIPGGWWLYDVNYDNFDEDAASTSDPSTMDIFFGDGYNYIDMAYFGSLQYSNRDNHIGIDISAEQTEWDEVLEDYMIGYIDYMLEPYEGDTYELVEESDATMHGRDFHQCIFLVNQVDRPYNILSMTCAVNDGYFLTLSGNYWPENKKAVENILQYMESGLNFL